MRVALLLLVVLFFSCSSDNSSSSAFDSTQSDTSLTTEPLALTPFTPDANWTTPTETVSQYGPSGIVRDVVIDRDGIIWLAAWDGIVSYDGKEFTNHTLKDGLSHHRVYSVMEDSKGNMWFGTMGAGAYKYDGRQFTNLSTNSGLVNNVLFDLFEDSKGNIWFATTAGVSMYDGKTYMNLDSSNGLLGEIYAISEDKNGVMWFGGEAGLFQYLHGDSTVAEVFTDAETHYSNVRDIQNNNGSIHFGSSSGFYAINQTDYGPLKVKRLTKDFTSYIHVDKSHNLLLTTNGILRYDVTTLSTADDAYDRMNTVVSNKNNLGIFGANEADDGTIWFGAMDGLHSVRDGQDVSYKKP